MHFRRITFLFLFLALGVAMARADLSIGPIYDRFPLTLAPGDRTEILGPLFYSEQKETQHTFALPPLFSCTRDPDVESEEMDLFYPLLTYDRFGAEYRFQILQVFAFAGGKTQEDDQNKRFTLFPIYFQQRSPDPEQNYTAIFPFYGTLKNRLFRDEIHFVMFPAYAKTRKKDIITANYLFPIFHLRHGNSLHGWQVWPFVGAEHKGVTMQTNYFAEKMDIIGGHEKFFAPWPIFLKSTTGIGTENPEEQISVLPLFTKMKSPQRDSFTAPWPIGLTITDDRARKYHEVGAPWPLIVFAHGEGKNVKRVWPFYSHASSTNMESDFYFWPVYKFNRFYSPPLDRTRMRILFFLYSDTKEKNLEADAMYRRIDFWPLFTFRKDLNGNERLQILSLLEPLLPNNKSVERDYSPLWSIWRAEKNPTTHARSQSLLWNLYRRDISPESKKCSLLFGLFQYQSAPEGTRWRVFYIPFGAATERTSTAETTKTK